MQHFLPTKGKNLVKSPNLYTEICNPLQYTLHNIKKCKLYSHILTTDITGDCDSGKRRPALSSERPKSTSLQLSDSNTNMVLSARWVLYSKTHWPTDRRS
jgi:hypothetical protein